MPLGCVRYAALAASVALDLALRSFAATFLDPDGALAGASCPVQIREFPYICGNLRSTYREFPKSLHELSLDFQRLYIWFKFPKLKMT